MKIPHPIPYQGSKRKLAARIAALVPPDIRTVYEPFCGSAAVSLALAAERRQLRFALSDSLAPLAELWSALLADPERVADGYERIWRAGVRDPEAVYEAQRRAFNRRRDPIKLLYLLTRCVKSAVRFNAAGAFNQAADRRRLGTRPERMRRELEGAAALLRGRTRARAQDFGRALARAAPGDLVYLDPPYQGTSGTRDKRYAQQLDRARLLERVRALRERGVPLILSFDGRTGRREHGTLLPAELGLVRLELDAGLSSQATLHGRRERTVESLYVSPDLLPRPR